MAMRDWAPELLQLLGGSGNWESHDDPYEVRCNKEIGFQGKIATLIFSYDEVEGELYLMWDPHFMVPSDVRALYEQAIDSLNTHIDKHEESFGQFVLDDRGRVAFIVFFDPEFEDLFLTTMNTVEDINFLADDVCRMCNEMYFAIRGIESGRVDQFLSLANVNIAGRA